VSTTTLQTVPDPVTVNRLRHEALMLRPDHLEARP